METKKISQEEYSLFAMGKLTRVSSVQKNTTDAGFDQVMNSSMKKNVDSDAEDIGPSVRNVKKEEAEKPEVKDVSQKKDMQEKNPYVRQKVAAGEESKAQAEYGADVEEPVSGEDVSLATVLASVGTVSFTENENEVSEEVVAALSQLITQAVSEALKLPEEEVEELLTQNGMTAADLLQPGKLEEFLLAWKGETDVTAFLVDEDLKESCDILKEAFATILPEDLQEKGVTLSEEELAQVMKALSKPEEALGVQKQESRGELLAEKPGEKVEENKEIKVSLEIQDSPDAETETKQEESKEEAPQMESMEKAGQTESKNEHLQPVESFVQHLEQSVAAVDGTTVTERVVQYREIVNQVVEQIKVVVRPESTNLSMQLNPEQLGRVTLHMTMKNGQMTASFFVQNEMAKEALESNIQTLRENLSTQGLKVESVEVSVSDFSLSERGAMEYGQDAQAGEERQKQPQGKQRRLMRMEELNGAGEELTEEEREAKSRMEAAGSTVDFTA